MDKTPKERIRDAARTLADNLSAAGYIGPLIEFYSATADEMDRQIAFDKAREAKRDA